MSSSRLETSLCGIQLKNPVLAASGTFGYGIEFADILDLNELGGLITKGLSREPIVGNPAPRLWHVHGGMLNSVGLQNVGVRAFVAQKLPNLRKYSAPVFANVFGYAVEDYVEVVRLLEDAEGIAGYELNVSCPNTRHGGMFFSSDPALLFEVVHRVRVVASRPVIVKLSPNVAQIVPLGKAAAEAGADALSLVNTVVSLSLDLENRRSHLGAGFGGLSGPSIKPIALRMVYEISQSIDVPVIGIGGILTGRDAAEFICAGATAVQVGAATFIDPESAIRIARELDRVLARLGVANCDQMRATLAQ